MSLDSAVLIVFFLSSTSSRYQEIVLDFATSFVLLSSLRLLHNPFDSLFNLASKIILNMKEPLKNRVIAVTGDFGQARTHENLKRWIEANGGKWASTVTKDATHLISSKEHWTRQTVLGTRSNHFHIVYSLMMPQSRKVARTRKSRSFATTGSRTRFRTDRADARVRTCGRTRSGSLPKYARLDETASGGRSVKKVHIPIPFIIHI